MSKRDKKQINIRLERELFDFLVEYSKENYKTITGILREIIADLYKSHKEQVSNLDKNNYK